MKKLLLLLVGLVAFTVAAQAQYSGHTLSANVSSFLRVEVPNYPVNDVTYTVTITNASGTINILVEFDSGYSSKWVNDTSSHSGHGIYLENLYTYAFIDLSDLPADTYTVTISGPGFQFYPQNPFYTPFLALYAD